CMCVYIYMYVCVYICVCVYEWVCDIMLVSSTDDEDRSLGCVGWTLVILSAFVALLPCFWIISIFICTKVCLTHAHTHARTHTHARAHARKHARTHARAHARTHALQRLHQRDVNYLSALAI